MSENPNEKLDGPFSIVFFTILSWAIVGYAFFQLIVFADPLGKAFFYSDNPNDIHYVIFGVIALSLLARFVGGMFFGKMSDMIGRLKTIRVVLISLLFLLVGTVFLFEYTLHLELLPIFFIISRILIGFFTGGIWPSGAVYAVEKLQYYYNKKEEKTYVNRLARVIFPSFQENKTNSPVKNKIEKKIKHLGWQAAWIQSGFHWAIFLEGLLLYYFLFMPNSFEEFWPTISWTGVILTGFGCLLTFFMKESKIWEEIRNKFPKHFSIKLDVIKKEDQKKIVNLWLITAGIMYLFYSTMGIITGYFPRSDYLVSFCTDEIPCNLLYGGISFVLVALIAHLVPGTHLTNVWSDDKHGQDGKIKGAFRRFFGSSKFYVGCIRLDPIIRCKRIVPHSLQDKFKKNAKENRDLLIILSHGYMSLYIAISIIVFFFLVFLLSPSTDLAEQSKGYFWMYVGVWIVIVTLLFIVTSTWAIIPSILASMFAVPRRNFWTSTIYTGGTIVGFAAPFVSMQIIQQFDHVWLMIPFILGALSIVIGSRSLIMDNPSRPGDKLYTH